MKFEALQVSRAALTVDSRRKIKDFTKTASKPLDRSNCTSKMVDKVYACSVDGVKQTSTASEGRATRCWMKSDWMQDLETDQSSNRKGLYVTFIRPSHHSKVAFLLACVVKY
jgi:hypothetical protein